MPSLRSRLLNIVMRQTMRPPKDKAPSVGRTRAILDKATKRFKRPDFVSVAVDAVTTADAGGSIPLEWVDMPDVNPQHVLLYFHGGGYVAGSPQTHADLTWRLAKAAGMRVCVPDYRLAPEHPCPAQIDDAEAVYNWLLAEGYAPEHIALGGDSAGGGLVISLLQRLRDKAKPMPRAAVVFSPWLDYTGTSDAYGRLADADPYITPDYINFCAQAYAGDAGADMQAVSPLYADMSGFCPMLVHVGELEVLFDDSVVLAHKIRAAGGDVQFKNWPGQAHVFQVMARFLPEARQSIAEVGAYLREKF